MLLCFILCFYALLFYLQHSLSCLCYFSFVHLDLYFIALSFVHLDLFLFVLKTLIINLNIKRLKALFGLWLLSLALWSYGPLGLRIRTLDLGLWISLCTVVTLPKFCLESLKFTSRHWVVLFMCRCYFELKRSSLCNENLAQAMNA